jgi:hypothetical protein
MLQKPQQDLDAISKFFSKYPGFAYTEEQGVAEEFYRMCDFFDWDRDDEERAEARQAFKDAMVIRFNSLYGTDVTDLANWHKLCIAVCIEPLPATILECKKVCNSNTLWLTFVSLFIGNQRYTCEPCRSGRYLRAGRRVVYMLGGTERVYDRDWEILSEGICLCRRRLEVLAS